MDAVFNRLTAWLAPILCFTAEEAWQSRHSDIENSVHLRSYDPIQLNGMTMSCGKMGADPQGTPSSDERVESARNDGRIGPRYRLRQRSMSRRMRCGLLQVRMLPAFLLLRQQF